MNHSKARARLNDHLERTLPPEQRREMASHLKDCGRCRDELAELEATVALLRRLPTPQPPPALAASVMARVRDGEAERLGPVEWLWRLLQPSVAAPIAAGMMGLALFIGAERGLLETPGAAPIEVAVVETESASEALAPVVEPRVGVVGTTAREGRELELAASDPTQRAQRRFARHWLLREARRPHVDQDAHSELVARTLSGAGHPHSPWMASHLVGPETSEPTNLALASYSRRR